MIIRSENCSLNEFGVFFFVIYPGAYVDINSSDFEKLTSFQKLKVFCAGAWHNFVVALLGSLFLINLPTLLFPLYSHNASQGVIVTGNSYTLKFSIII